MGCLMQKKTNFQILMLKSYNHWATEATVPILALLKPEQLSRAATISYIHNELGSFLKIRHHLWIFGSSIPKSCI